MNLRQIIVLAAAALFISFDAKAVDLTFTNLSGGEARIDSLGNRCGPPLVQEKSPIHLKNGESYTFKNIVPVIHTYTVCGGGLCSSSALGIKDSKTYSVKIVSSGGLIDVVLVPDHWVGNRKCPK